MGEGLLSCSDITSALQVEGVDTNSVIDDTGDEVVAGSLVNDDSGVTVLYSRSMQGARARLVLARQEFPQLRRVQQPLLLTAQGGIATREVEGPVLGPTG